MASTITPTIWLARSLPLLANQRKCKHADRQHGKANEHAAAAVARKSISRRSCQAGMMFCGAAATRLIATASGNETPLSTKQRNAEQSSREPHRTLHDAAGEQNQADSSVLRE